MVVEGLSFEAEAVGPEEAARVELAADLKVASGPSK